MLQLESVHKQYSTKVLLEGATAHLRPGARVGLVGPNGAGKTTLFRMILGEESPDKGTIRKRPRLRVGYLPQELETIVGKTVLDAAHRDIYPEHEAERILSGLGFTEADFSRPIENLSGGYRMRVALAHLLLSNPDVLMLDEPTNHLDKPTQRWFERFLLESNLTLLVISHDTKFLDGIATHIWELRDRTLQEYRGNYTKFQELRAARDAQIEAAANRQSKEVARVQSFIDRFRYQANKAKQVQSRIKQLDKVKLIERQRDTKRVRFKFPLPRPAAGTCLSLRVWQRVMARKLFTAPWISRWNAVSGSHWWVKTVPAKARCSRCWPASYRSKRDPVMSATESPCTTLRNTRPNP